MNIKNGVFIIRVTLAGAIALFSCGITPLYAVAESAPASLNLYTQGVEFYSAGNLSEAKELFEKALEANPDNTDARVYLNKINTELKTGNNKILASLPGEYSDDPESYMDLQDNTGREPGSENKFRQPGRKPRPPQSYIKDAVDKVSEVVEDTRASGQLRGEYKMSIGVTSEEFIWNEANGDYNERNFRMISRKDFPSRTNTFDTRVYDRFKAVFDTNQGGEGLNFHSDITVDPWSFVGRTNKFTISTAQNDRAELQLKYWAGTGKTLNEKFFTLVNGNSFSTPEIKVHDGKTTPVNIVGGLWDQFPDTFVIPEQDIDFTFQPIREMWFDYNRDDYSLRVFPFALEDQALSSDDPLGISNRHIYWEPSPWLDDWVPGSFNTGGGAQDFWKGRWSDDLSFVTRDSDLKRLTALRGVSFKGPVMYNTDLSMTIASPKGLWQEYDSFTSVPGAIRTKTQVNDELSIGAIETFRIGINEGSTDSYNNTFGIDVSYDMDPATNIVAEVAASKSKSDMAINEIEEEEKGGAFHLGIKRDTNFGDARLAFTFMDEGFEPGLANYKHTRRDMHWGRHIHFKRPLQYDSDRGTSLNYEDIEPFRIGDGIDSGRRVVNFRLKTEDALGGDMQNLIDYRYVNENHKYVEGVFREENTYKILPKWTSKLLFLYHDLPKTKGGIDPIQFDSDSGEFLKNTLVKDGEDPSVSTYSVGLEYQPEDWISVFGIYENTNDYKFGTDNHPSGLLNSAFAGTKNVNGQTIRVEVPQLYSQQFFDLPPYERFNIYRVGVQLKPSEKLGIDFDYTKNDFKFAAGIDDNMNHFGTTVKYKFTPKLVGFLKYTFSKSYNLFRLTTSGNLKYQEHHNIFMEFNYDVNENGFLVVQFGEGSVVSPTWGAAASPFGDFYPTLDTQQIVRIYYQGIF